MLVELVEKPPGFLSASFEINQSHRMRIDLEINLTGDSDVSSSEVTEIRRILDNSRYRLAAPDLCQECYWHDILSLINRCHEQARSVSKRFVTTVRIEETMANLPTEDNASEFIDSRDGLLGFGAFH
jgi:uncharacterized protein YqgV (UPF0045/DUF77 family)